MSDNGSVRRYCLWGVVVAFLWTSLACNALTKPFAEEDAGAECEVPDVVGLDRDTAAERLSDLGLTPVVVEAYDDVVAEGDVISLNPSAGAVLSPCEGEVTLRVSKGEKEEISSHVEPTAVPTPSSSDQDGPPDEPPLQRILYQEPFETGAGGFRPEWSVDAAYDASYLTENGELVTEGYVAAYVGDDYWYDYSVTFGNADYSEITDFQVMVRMQDEDNYIGMQCFVTDGRLACEGRKVVDGQEGPVQGFQATTSMCAIGQLECVLTLDALQDQYKVLVNGEERISFVDDTFVQGGVGFVVDGKWVVDFIEIYEPQRPASAGYTMFRDDFGRETWSTGSLDDDYVTSEQYFVSAGYIWEVTAKQGVLMKEYNEIYVPFDPDRFPYHFSLSAAAQRVSGAEDATYGLLFRCRDYDNLYYFSVRDNGYAAFYRLDERAWTELVAPMYTEAVRPGERNLLRVDVDGDTFYFFVNDEYLFQASDESFPMEIGVGLALELSQGGDEATVAFDDFTIRVR